MVNAPLIVTVLPTTVLTKIASPSPLFAANPGTIPDVLPTVKLVLPGLMSLDNCIANAFPSGVLVIPVTCVPTGNAGSSIGAPTSGTSPVNANLFSAACTPSASVIVPAVPLLNTKNCGWPTLAPV